MPTANEMLSEADFATLIRIVTESRVVTGAPEMLRTQGTLAPLGIHGRIDAIASALLADAGARFDDLCAALLVVPDFTGWATLAVSEAAARRSDGDLDLALDQVRRLTPLMTSEFAARTILLNHRDAALPTIVGWAHDPDEHVRRLASECTRPRLPWGARMDEFAADDAPTREMLDHLHDDESAYVRRSVANHVNDVSRLNPERAIAQTRSWDVSPAAAQSVRHALRTLIKQGHPDALRLIGVDSERRISVSGPLVQRTAIALGESLIFDFEIRNDEPTTTRVVVDYIVHFAKANGGTLPKTFKLAARTLAPGEHWRGTRTHPIVPISTRKYYSGPHQIQLQVNGLPGDLVDFSLTV